MKRILLGAVLIAPSMAAAQDMSGMSGMDHGTPAAPAASPEHATAMPGMDMGAMSPGEGAWSAGSGTSRVPGTESMAGMMSHAGDWMVMTHGYVWGVYTDQGGQRGGEKAFVESMGMVSGTRPLGDGARLELRGMVSLDPVIGQRGYPNLFATGESAHGEALIDRQHPHDFFMELSARADVDVAPGTSIFLYGGLPGEPALGPPAYMHRGSARLNPEAPIAHHWFDSTHITFGVVTAGVSSQLWQLEASAFKGREPNEERWGIDRPKLDSWSVRGTLTPAPEWALQVSYGRLESAEALEADGDEKRFTASAGYTDGPIAVTIGYARKDKLPGPVLDAVFGEATLALRPMDAVYGRIERVENDEWFRDGEPLYGTPFHAAKVTIGYAHGLAIGEHLRLDLGGSVSAYAKSDALDRAYGQAPKSFTLSAKLSLAR